MSICNSNFIETCLLQKFHSVYLNGNKLFTTYLHYPKNLGFTLYSCFRMFSYESPVVSVVSFYTTFSESLRFKILDRLKTAGIACQKDMYSLSFILTLASAQDVFTSMTVIVNLLFI